MAGNKAVFQEALRKAHNHAWDRKWNLAVAEYRRALAENSSDPQVWVSLGGALLELKRLADAKEAFRRASDLAPDDVSHYQKLADVYERLGDRENALATHLQIATLLQAGPAPEQALDAWRAILRLQPMHTDARVQLADLLERLGQRPEAARENVTLARMLRERGRASESTERARRALSLDVQNADARALVESTQLDVVSPDGSGVRPPAPEVADPGKDSPLQRDVQLAQARLAESVLENTPRTKGLQTGAGQLFAQALDLQTRARLDDAIDVYRQATNAGFGTPDVQIILGQLCYELVRLDESIAAFQKSLQSPSLVRGSHFGLALCFRKRREIKPALEHMLAVYRMIEAETQRPERAGHVEAAYARLARHYGEGLSAAESASLVDALIEFLNASGWQERAANLRDKAEAIEANGETFCLPELVSSRRPELVVDALHAVRELSAQNKLTAAVDACYYAVSSAPTFLPIHQRLAELFARQGRVEDSVAKYMAVAALQSARGDVDDEMTTYRSVLLHAPDNVEMRLRMIELLKLRENHAELVDQYMLVGESYSRVGQLDHALQAYESALRLAPRAGKERLTVTLLHRVGDIYLQRAAWKDAVQVYLQIRQMTPGDDKASLRLIDLYFKLGREPETENELAHLITLYEQSGEGAKLIPIVTDMTALRPRNSVLKNYLVDLLVKSGRTAEAVAQLDALGEVQLKASQTREAIQTIERIVTLGPANVDDYRKLLAQLRASL